MKDFFKKINFTFIFSLLISLAFYIIPSLFFKIDKEYYYSLSGPKIPPIVFIIVWSIIYILMSILNAYYINLYKENKSKELWRLFAFILINYIFNILYIPFFFILKDLFLSYVICLFIFVTIIFVGLESLVINKKITLLTIPYILWSAFASVIAILFYLQN